MQTIEKALHQPMPFTTGGQTISDRLTAAKHSLAGSQLGKTICKATTEELMAPKKKHLDYLLHCTNEPNVSIPSMANLLIERTQHPSWTIVYKALITIHNIMCYGNERFSQYLASCNTTFNLGNFLDKNSSSGYDMSQHVRRYGKYIGEKIATYRTCAFDFCKVKRGREDGLLRTMHTDKLLKTLPILQNQIDALLEFQVSSSELNNGVINCSFILLFRDLIRLFACYNDGIINLLEKYFDMNKKQCREALDTYKGFLTRLDKVADFLRVAESVGIDRGEIPDLTRAPASLLEALEAHLIHLEGGRAPPPTQQFQSAQHQVNNFSISGGFQAPPQIADSERERYLELEKETLRQFSEQRRQQGGNSQFNPFASESASGSAPSSSAKTNDDLLDLFNSPAQGAQQPIVDNTNPFAQFTSAPAAPAPSMYNPMSVPGDTNPFLAETQPAPTQWSADFSQQPSVGNPFAAAPETGYSQPPPPPPPPQQQQQQQPLAYAPPSQQSSEESTPIVSQPITSVPPASTYQSAPIPVAQQQRLGIYEQTPFSHMDGSYTSQPAFPPHMQQATQNSSAEQSPAHQGFTQQSQQPVFDPFNTNQARMGGDIDTALSSLANNLNMNDNKAQPTQSVQWGGSAAAPSRPPAPTTTQPAMTMSYGQNQQFAQPQYTAGYGQFPNQQQMGWGMPQQQGMYGMPVQQPAYVMNPQMGYNQMGAQMPYSAPQQSQQPNMTQQQPKDPFSGF